MQGVREVSVSVSAHDHAARPWARPEFRDRTRALLHGEGVGVVPQAPAVGMAVHVSRGSRPRTLTSDTRRKVGMSPLVRGSASQGCRRGAGLGPSTSDAPVPSADSGARRSQTTNPVTELGPESGDMAWRSRWRCAAVSRYGVSRWQTCGGHGRAGRRSRRGSGGPLDVTGRGNPCRPRLAVLRDAAGFVTGPKSACGRGPAGSRDSHGSHMRPGPTRERRPRGSYGGGPRPARTPCRSGTRTPHADVSL